MRGLRRVDVPIRTVYTSRSHPRSAPDPNETNAMSFRRLIFAFVLLAPAVLTAAALDDNVEWAGLSHVTWLDRAPLCPVDGEAFEVRFQAYRNDLTAAYVHVDDGAPATIEAFVSGERGPYAVWSATVPATAATSLSYHLELVDGSDADYLSVDGLSDAAPTDGGFVLDFTTLAHAPVGATPLPGGGAVFKVWSPSTTGADVRGGFNGWATGTAMTRVGEYLVSRETAAAVGDQYKYVFEGSHWNTDPRARRLNPTDNYNAFLIDPDAYVWSVADFDVPDFEEMVIYQLHVGTFAGRNDPYGATSFPSGFLDVAARAGHLAELGVNAVMLNPIHEFPWDYSAGYNPVTMWAPEWIYGDPDALKAMIDTLHAHGIAVLLDIVWNHLSYSDNFMWWYDGSQIYFDDPAVDTPWGSQADFDAEAVRDYYVDSALLWLDEYRFDGFRMDATSYMNIEPQDASGWSLMQRFNDEMDARAIDKIAIAEQLPDNSWVTRPTSIGGAGFDAQYYDNFVDQLRSEIFDAAAGDPEMWRIRSLVLGGGAYLEGRQVVNYLELHDEAWPESGGQRIVKTIDTTSPHDDIYARGRVKLAQGVVLTAPGIPAILQGTEWLEDYDFGTDAENRIDWSKKATYADVFDYFSDLIALRTSSPALRADAGVEAHHLNESGNVIAFRRWDLDGNHHVVICNFGNTDLSGYRVGLPVGGDWVETINSQDPAYGGAGPVNGGVTAEAVAYNGQAWSAEFDLAKMALVVLSPDDGTAVEESLPESRAGARLLGAYPNPFNPSTTIEFELARAGEAVVAVYDTAGRRVRTLVRGALPAGVARVVWDGADDAGAQVASGVYFVRLEAGASVATDKLVLLK